MQSFGQATKEERNYIYKDSLQGYAQSIFFETDKESIFYNDITRFEMRNFDQDSYTTSLKYLSSNKLSLQKRELILPSKEWLPLQQYHGEYYAYHPCDFYHFYKVSINDSTYIDWTAEGAIANKIIGQRKLNDSTYELSTKGILEQHRTIRITLVDSISGIAVFEETTATKSPKYLLMIMADKLKSVGFIVNVCITEKKSELKFERPNFEKLLKMNKK